MMKAGGKAIAESGIVQDACGADEYAAADIYKAMIKG